MLGVLLGWVSLVGFEHACKSGCSLMSHMLVLQTRGMKLKLLGVDQLFHCCYAYPDQIFGQITQQNQWTMLALNQTSFESSEAGSPPHLVK